MRVKADDGKGEWMRKLRMGMVGGGPGAFIGGVHRIAAQLDGQIELVCGAFSSDPAKSRAAGAELFLDPARVYDDFAAMMAQEAALPADRRMDFVAIVTPNHMHHGPALAALEAGFHVIVDKPLCRTMDEALSLERAVAASGLVFAVTHTYAGYPMVKEARALIARGGIGAVRKIYVEYPQGWLATAIEGDGQKQAAWRTDPARSGAGGAIVDIGTHAAHLAEYVSGRRIRAIDAMLNTLVAGRRLDDDASMLLRFDDGASGVLIATQVAVGEENGLAIRVYGETAGIEWRQTEPNTLIVRHPDRPAEIRRTGWGYVSEEAARFTRTPSGHPEGYLEAFANIYREFARAIRRFQETGAWEPAAFDMPGIAEGVRGMAFIEAAIRSSETDRKWTELA